MTAPSAFVAMLADEIAHRSEDLGRKVVIDRSGVLDRSEDISLRAPSRISPNGSCRLIAARDGWIAVNLPRDDDDALVAAWLQRDINGTWDAIAEAASAMLWRDLVENAVRVGLAVAGVGEITASDHSVSFYQLGGAGAVKRTWRVLDLSNLWAGPLCGGILAEMGAEVTKWESVRRPDVGRHTMPRFYDRLNMRKAHVAFDHSDPRDIAELFDAMCTADVVITGARPRVFEQWGMPPQKVFSLNPSLVWVGITGFGWFGRDGARIAFGDDAAAAGGLVRWKGGAPEFSGDALADPITGLSAAASAMKALSDGGGVFVDAGMARISARAAALSAAI